MPDPTSTLGQAFRCQVPCALCGDTVDTGSPHTWRQVTVWVHGPKANGACMQGTEVLAWAHDSCARLARRGIPVGQGALL